MLSKISREKIISLIQAIVNNSEPILLRFCLFYFWFGLGFLYGVLFCVYLHRVSLAVLLSPVNSVYFLQVVAVNLVLTSYRQFYVITIFSRIPIPHFFQIVCLLDTPILV